MVDERDGEGLEGRVLDLGERSTEFVEDWAHAGGELSLRHVTEEGGDVRNFSQVAEWHEEGDACGCPFGRSFPTPPASAAYAARPGCRSPSRPGRRVRLVARTRSGGPMEEIANAVEVGLVESVFAAVEAVVLGHLHQRPALLLILIEHLGDPLQGRSVIHSQEGPSEFLGFPALD